MTESDAERRRQWSQEAADYRPGDDLRDSFAVLRLWNHHELISAQLAEAERDASRWRNARRLAAEISDPELRGIVTSFLDRFG